MVQLPDLFKNRTGKTVPRNQISVSSVGPIARHIQQPATGQSALPRAAAIYGAAAAVFAVLTIFMLFKGQWVTGLIMIVPTFCLGGFAYLNMK
jgi:hypothetical protein